jgi:sterol desaturase/sphingolipid hydroxylase (fatty acid hydroxylase superfamily)
MSATKVGLGVLGEMYLSNSWIAWGLGPLLASGLGFFVTFLFVELLEASGFVSEKDAIVYNKASTRAAMNKKTRERIPLAKQLQGSVYNSMGTPAFLNAISGALILPVCIHPSADAELLPHFETFVKQFVIMQLVGDLFLYIGHRVQHEVPYFWKNYHSIHHAVDTPTTASTAYIHPIDAFLQAALPMLLTAVVAQAHPLVFSFYVFTRLSENTINHCGYDHWLINFMWLKFLPFRASIRHHDEHHRFSNRSGSGGKNFGENFVIWDWAFKTLRGPISITHQN